ncbi:MAG TPA: DUF4867 domain-containing protein [Lachnospiraceae bacterium]|jgi:hypothetical protein|nr:DUF4867 domain-containing protein [Lachnospiraceae bacterium]
MTIYSVTDPEFKSYGRILSGLDTKELTEAMKTIALPAAGTNYQAGIDKLEALPIYAQLQNNVYGGMPVQVGMCWGRNTKLNCLEYHRDSEINIGTDDFILLLALRSQIRDGKLDTSLVKAFRVPAGTAVEVFATTLHYAPCHTDAQKGFRVAIVLPKGTNTDKPAIQVKDPEDRLLFACNKWLLAHKDAPEAGQGAYIGLTGENIDIA